MARRRRRKSDEAPGWVWMLFGLGIGLIIALGVYLNGPQIFADDPATAGSRAAQTAVPTGEAALPLPADPALTTGAATPSDAAADAPGSAANVTASATQAATNSGAQTAQPRAQTEDPNRFSFYDLLPSFEVVIPEVETPAVVSEPVAVIEAPGIYMLQAGSFLTENDAEAQRARLALLGIETRIQRVSIDDRTFHRVRIGPIQDLDTLNDVRSRLRTANVDSMIMRIDP